MEDIKILILRGDFDDQPMPLTDREWRAMLERRVDDLEQYLDDFTHGRARVQFHISQIHRFERAADVFSPALIANALMQRYQDNALTSPVDTPSRAENVTAFVYSFPSVGLIGDAGALGGYRSMWMPGSSVLTEGFIHEFGHTFELGHVHALEGAPFGTGPSEHEIFTTVVKGSADGLHMLGSEGDGRTGGHTSYPVPYLNIMKFLPDEYVSEINSDGRYRIHDSALERLPGSTDDKLAYKVIARGRPFWFAFTPNHKESWAQFDSDGFERGLVIHWNYRNDLFALLDFTPNSYRSSKSLAEDRHPELLFKDTRDGSLQIGDEFTLPDTDIAIRPISAGNEDGRRYLEFNIRGINSNIDDTFGIKELNYLVLRGDYADNRSDIGDDLWIRQQKWYLRALRQYFGRYGYGRVIVNFHVMTAPAELENESAFTSRRELSLALQDRYRELTSNSDEDDIAALNDATHIIYSTPRRTISLNEDLPDNNLNGVPATFTGLSGSNVPEVLKNFATANGLEFTSALEGAPAGASPTEYRVFTEDLRNSEDGIFVLGAAGNNLENGLEAPLPGFHLNQLGFLPDHFIGNLTGVGNFRLYDGALKKLPRGDEKPFYSTDVAGRTFWLSYFPVLTELFDNDDDPSSFDTGIVVQWEKPDGTTSKLATLDFTPNSVRSGLSEEERRSALYRDTRDGALQIGDRFQFPDSSLVLEPIRVGSDALGRYIDIRISTE